MDVERFTTTDTGIDPRNDDPSVQTFIELALGIAEAWKQDLTQPRSWRSDPADLAFQYAVRLCLPEDQIDPTTPGIACLELRTLDPAHPFDLGWPEIRLTSADGVRMTLERETVRSSAALYRPARDGHWPGNGRFEFEFFWRHLNCGIHQNALGWIRVIRNADLLQTCTGQPGTVGPATHPDFVSTTGAVATPSPITPQINPSCVLPLEGPDLGAALEAALALLFRDNPLESQATVSLRYASSPVGDLGLEVVQPVALSLPMPLKEVPKACAERVHEWTSRQGSPVVGGRWEVELNVYSAVADASPLPIYSGRFCYPGSTVGPV